MTTIAPRARLFKGTPTYPKGEGFGVRIGSDWYRLATGPQSAIGIGTKDSLADRLDQRGSVYENVLDLGYVFSRNDLNGGEGLSFYPRTSQIKEQDPLDAIRFWSSHNLNIQRPDSGDPPHVALSRPFIEFWTPADPPVDMEASAEFIYVAHGTSVSWFLSWENNTPVGSFDFAVSNVKRIEVEASNQVFALLDDGTLWYKPFNSPTFEIVYDLSQPDPDNIPLQNIWLAKGRILAERVNLESLEGVSSLVEGTIVNNGTPGNPDYEINFTTLDNSPGRFRHCIDAGEAIIAAVGDGSLRSYVPQADSAGTVPALTIRGRTPLPPGEEPLTLGYINGVFLYLTLSNEEGLGTRTVRLYEGKVEGENRDFVPGNIRLLRTWKHTTEGQSITKRMSASRDRIFWTVEEEDHIEEAWYYDVITTGIGQITHVGFDSTAITRFDSLVGVIDLDNNRVIRTDPENFQPVGYLISPNINFGLNTKINWSTVVLEAQNIASAGDQVELWRSTDPDALHDWQHESWILAARLNNPSQSGLEVPLGDVLSNSLALQVRLYPSGAGTRSPALIRFAVRGFPAHRDWILDVPVNVSDTISAPGRMPYRISGWGNEIHKHLLNTSGLSVEAVLLDPPFWIRGVVDQVSEPVEYVSERGSVMRHCMVRIRGTRITDVGQGSNNEGLGIGRVGVVTVGIEKRYEEI